MGRDVLDVSMSLDGFTAGPNVPGQNRSRCLNVPAAAAAAY